LYVAPTYGSPGLTILDVTDPKHPRQVKWIDGSPEYVGGSCLVLDFCIQGGAGNRMIT